MSLMLARKSGALSAEPNSDGEATAPTVMRMMKWIVSR